MWLHLAVFLIIGTAIADLNHAWETENEYHYLIKSWTLTGLDELDKQYSGIFIRCNLIIQVKSSDTLQAVVSETQYASVNEKLPNISDEISDLEYHELSLSGKPFEIKLKQGVIRDMLVDQDVPTWEVNLLKSIVSQLQIDTEGENAIASRSTMMPTENQSVNEFKVTEDSVGGKCEVLYSISPVKSGDNLSKPLPHLHKDGQHLAITKTKNFSRCEQRVGYHSGIVGKITSKPGFSDGFLSRSSSNYIIIFGNLKRFTIQSSVMTSQISINSDYKLNTSTFRNTYSGTVYSGMNLTLDRMNQITNRMPASNNLVSTGNLVYTYNNPFFNQFKSHCPNDSESSLVTSSKNHNSSNSSEENRSDNDNFKSKEHDYFQPKPKLNDAPESLLLSYFIGYKDILKSEENYTQLATNLIIQTYQDEHMYYASLSPTLERFTILVKLIRTMNVEQIAEVENLLPEIYPSDSFDVKDERWYNQTKCRYILYNAVANAGTGPALITIKNLIKTGKLEGIQAAQVISKIPKSVLVPTVEYVAAFFELITDEKVTKQRFLNTTAPLSFAELAYYTYSYKSSVYFPIYNFDCMMYEDQLLETYIPYMATQLRKAVEEGDSRRIQTYIMALGKFGHGKILSVFEPYLEGTIPVSKFQRLMMIVSLSRLTEVYPRVVRSVAYKIYINKKEAYELRCAAVHIIMKTNPPLIMLERIADFTNQDEDRHVNSVVKTSIESLVNLKQPEWKNLADKARIASKLLNPNINNRNSQSIFMENKIPSLNLIQTSILQTIGSNDNNVPKGTYIDILQSYGGLNLPLAKIMYAVTSMEEFKQMWIDIWLGKRKLMSQNKTEWMIERIIEKLSIEPENAEQLEGNIFVDSAFSLEFFPFDNHTFEEFTNMAYEFYESVIQRESFVFQSETVSNLHNYDITLGFPTETGLPFIYNLAIPKLTIISKEGSLKIIKSETDKFVQLAVEGHVTSSEKILSRIGFITPFEHRHYIAGVDIYTQLIIPGSLSVKARGLRKFELKIGNKKHHDLNCLTIEHSVVPYTSRQDILSFEPLERNNDTRLVHTKEPSEATFSLGDLTLSANGDVIDKDTMSQNRGLDGFIKFCTIFYSNLGASYRKFNAILHLREIQVNLTYHQSERPTNRSSEATIPTIIDKQPDSMARESQFLEEVVKDNRSVNSSKSIADVFDISVSANNNRYVFTYALGDNHDNLQTLLYGNVQLPDGKVPWEFCSVNSIVGLSWYNHLDVEKAIEKVPNYEFNSEMRFGSCANGEMIRLKGNLSRTNDVMKKIMNSEVVEKCQQQIKQGNIWLPTCQKANKLIQYRDLLMMSMETNSFNLYLSAVRMIMGIKMNLSNKEMSMANLEESTNKNMDVEIKMPLDDSDANISLRTSHAAVTFSLSNFISDPNVMFPNLTMNKLFENDLEGDMCVLDKTQVVTFDNKIYPLTLGKCWHVMMAPSPQRDTNNPDKILSAFENVRAIVMAREMDDGSKQVWIILGDEEIRLRKLNDRLQVNIVNDEEAYFSDHKSYVQPTYEIYHKDEMIIVHSQNYTIHIVYDGERILLYVSDQYRNIVRGLCGNYDTQFNNDFIAPKNCILTEPEEFAATYALTYQEDCEGPALQNKVKAEQSTCTSRSYIPSDVISEREAGRVRRNGRWGYCMYKNTFRRSH